MSDLQVFPISIPGGIEQSKPDPEETDLEELENFGIFRNRIGLRPPITAIATLLDAHATTPVEVDAILDIVEHEGKMWIASWSSTEQDVYLSAMQVDGNNINDGFPAGAGADPDPLTVYTGVAAKPVITLTSFAGGDASTGVARLYVTDYNQNLPTKYIEGTTVNTLTADLDASSAAEDIYFSLMIPFKFHLWGTGFYEGTTERSEMLRFSQPGLIPGTDIAGGTNPREWWTADHRSVGRRGDKIVAVSKAGDRLIVFQKRATHAIYGSGSLTWTRQELSDVIGCVGPHAVATVDERVCYFWASDGPYRTDGSQIQYIGQPIRQLAVEVDSDEIETRVGYSPDDGLVYFLVSPGGADEYSLALVFDHRRERWMKTQWLASAGVNLEFGSLEFLDSVSSPAPAGAPSTLAALASSDTQIDLTWVNGDANINTETRIYRDTTTGFTPSDITNRIDIVGSGVEAYSDTGLTACTTYYYKVVHVRNSQASSDSNEAFDTTAFTPPNTVALAGLTDGLRITGNNPSDEDVEIWRSTDGANFSLLTTLVGPGTTFSHDDTGLTVDATYYYYAVAVAATSGATTATSAWTDFSEFSTGAGVPTGMTLEANTPGNITVSVGTDGTEGNYVNIVQSSFESCNLTIDAFDGITADTEDGAIELLARVYIASNPTNNRSYIGGGVFMGGTGNNIDGIGSRIFARTTTDHESQLVQVINNSGSVPASGDMQEAEISGPEWVWHRIRLEPNGANDDYYTKAWSGEIADEPAGWDGSDIGNSKRTFASLGTNVGIMLHSLTHEVIDHRISFLSVAYTSGGTLGTPKPGSSECDDSEASSTVSRAAGDATTAPSAPTTPTATANGETQIDLTWADASDNEDNFRIERSLTSGSGFAYLTNKAAGSTSHSDTGLDTNTTYYYQIRAENNAGNSAYTSEVSDTTDPNLDTPTGVSASGATISTIDLAWTENAGDESGIQVWQSNTGSGGTYSLVHTTASNATSYTVTGLSATTQYHYKLRAVLGAVVGSYSAIVEDTTIGSPPSDPTSLTATKNVGTPTTIIDLAWTDNASNEEFYLVQRKSGAGSFATITSSVAADSTSYQDTGLTPGTTYTYRVKATNATNGDSGYSNEASDTTDGVASVPADPSGLSATGDDSDLTGLEKSAVDISWTDNADNEDNYEIERCAGASCTSWAALVTLASDVEDYTDATVNDNDTANTIYRYRVRATNVTGNSAWITSGDVTVEPRCTPSNVSAADSSSCTGPTANPELTVTWDQGDVTGIVTRTVERSVGGGSFSTLTTSPDTSTSHVDDTVSFGSSYRYRIKYSFGTTGENTGDFTSSNSSAKSPVDPDCPPEL